MPFACNQCTGNIVKVALSKKIFMHKIIDYGFLYKATAQVLLKSKLGNWC